MSLAFGGRYKEECEQGSNSYSGFDCDSYNCMSFGCVCSRADWIRGVIVEICQILGCPHIARYWYAGEIKSVLGVQEPKVRIKVCDEHAGVLSEGSDEYLSGVSNVGLRRFEKING